MIERYLTTTISETCFDSHKMAFLSGPRQCGKTTISKMLLDQRKEGAYYSWDNLEVKRIWAKDPFQLLNSDWGTSSNSKTPLIILDEIHKARGWKNTLKGLYDSLPLAADILVTGSAKLNVYKRGSDSLMGRYYHFRLHPFSIAELEKTSNLNPNEVIDQIWQTSIPYKKEYAETIANLMRFGGFPEPLLQQSEKKWRLWLHGRIEKIVREDLRDLSRIPELSQLETLVALLPDTVGSALSVQSLSEDIGVSFNTIKRWLSYFRELYFSFEIRPYHNNIRRSLKKDAKLYLWDYSQITDPSAKFENLVAAHLLKACHFWSDAGEGQFELFYLRDKDKREIDFLITKDQQPWLPVEVKLSEKEPSPNFKIFMKQLTCKRALQIINIKDYRKKHVQDDFELIVASADTVLPYFV